MEISKESIDILKRIQPAIENIIKKECDNIYNEYEENKIKNKKIEQENKILLKECNIKENAIIAKDNYIWRLRWIIELLSKDWVIELFEDWDSWYDEYWNWWWYRVEFVKYKWEQIEINYESF